MKISIAQISPVVGDFSGNLAKISKVFERAVHEGADLVLTPELGVCGYPLHDLVERPEILSRCTESVEALKKLTSNKKTALLVGSISSSPFSVGRPTQNVVHVLQNGQEVFRQAKSLLPTYDIFDEARYFEPGKKRRFGLIATGEGLQ